MEPTKDKILVTIASRLGFRKKLSKLLSYNKDLLYIWNEVTLLDFLKAGLTKNDFEELLDIKKQGIKEKECEICEQENIRIIYNDDKEFPELLNFISDKPYYLFAKGHLDCKNTIGIVGSRKPTRYGTTVATTFSERLARAGLIVVSGLAIGIDALAHLGALSGKGTTIAVLGSGIDEGSIYPQTNWQLAKKILESSGAIISEYPPNYPIHRMNFPERNRIISGLSEGVLIVEAREKSGALITADFALEQGREIFAVPHDVTRPESRGGNVLLKQGAIPITEPKDILDYWGIETSRSEKINGDSPNEDSILEILSYGSYHADEISRKSGLTIEETSATLSLMEIKGIIINEGAQTFALKK